jgi:hypothetical protein
LRFVVTPRVSAQRESSSVNLDLVAKSPVAGIAPSFCQPAGKDR